MNARISNEAWCIIRWQKYVGAKGKIIGIDRFVQVLLVERSSTSLASLWRASSQLAGAYRLILLVFFPFLIINANCEEALAFF